MVTFCILGCNMSIKVQYLHSHLDGFPENLDDVSENQGECFVQNIGTIEERYRGYWNVNMMDIIAVTIKIVVLASPS